MVDARRSVSAAAKAAQSEDAWPEPIPLTRSDALSPFPVDALPEWMRAFVRELAIFTQTPAEMGAACALGAVAALCGGRVWIEPRPRWIEGTNIYVAICAPPGTRKSPVVDATTRPLREYERDVIARRRDELAAHDSRRELLELSRERIKTELRAAKKRSDGTRLAQEAEFAALGRELAQLEQVHEFRILAGDVTPERLLELLAEQRGRMAIVSDEDTLLGHLSGRYSTRPMIEPFLSAFSNMAITLDRKRDQKERRIRIERPALTIVTALQPGLLEEARANKKINTRGLFERFAFIVPRNLIGVRDMEPPIMSDDVVDAYACGLRRIAEEFESESRTLRLDDQAAARFLRWRTELECRRGDAGDLALVQGWASKADGLTARLAALVHVAAGNAGELVGASSMDAAIVLCRALAEHALAAADTLGTDPVIAGARAVLAWARDEDVPTFTARDAQRALRARFRNAKELQAALVLLAEHHMARMRKVPTGGRPSGQWDLSPRLLSPSVPVPYKRSEENSLS
jgi:replicative DNA helicase